jgi:hypothetical protein
MSVINALRPEERSQGLKDLRCWHVGYQLCDLKAKVTIYAKDEVEARRAKSRSRKLLSRMNHL